MQVNAAGGLTLAASADVIGVLAGQSVTYTITYSNRSGAELSGAILHVAIPAGTTLQSTDGEVNGDRIFWDLATVAAGSHGIRRFTVQIKASTPEGSIFVMQAGLSIGSGHVAEVEIADMVVPNNMSLSLTASPDPVAPGGLVSYVVTATSQLASSANFRILMPVPDHMTVKPHPGFTCSVRVASGDCPSGAVLTQDWDFVQAGKTHSYTFAMRLDSGVDAPSDGTVIPAAATVQANNFTSSSAQVGIRLAWPSQPVLSITPPTLDFGTVTVGSLGDLTFIVTNTGTGTLTGTASVSAPFNIISGSSFDLAAG